MKMISRYPIAMLKPIAFLKSVLLVSICGATLVSHGQQGDPGTAVGTTAGATAGATAGTAVGTTAGATAGKIAGTAVGTTAATTDDGFDIRTASFLLPQALPKGKYYQSFYIQYLVLPRDWITQILKAPVLYYTGKYTLPYGFNLQGSLATLLISNRINLGPFWNYSINNYHFAVGWQVVFNYGFLNDFGFNTTLTGWEQQPSITMGYSFKKMAVILRTDLYWANAFYMSEAKNVIPYTSSFINGYIFNANLEQRLWKNRILSVGMKLYNCKYSIIAWPAFPVNPYRYWFPEFQIGLEF